MTVAKLRAYLKEKGFRGYSTMKKEELKQKVSEFKAKETAEKYEEELKNTAVCKACLEQQRIQRKIDDKIYYQRLLESTVMTLVFAHCRHANFIYDGDETICVDCGVVQASYVDINSRRFR